MKRRTLRFVTADPSTARRADAVRNRERVLEAARSAFKAHAGPVTLGAIAADAGVGIATLYRHFPTREALAEAVYREELDALAGDAGALLEQLGPEAALHAWADRYREHVSSKRGMADALRSAMSNGTISKSEVRTRLGAALQAIIDAGARGGTLRADVRAEDVIVGLLGIFTVAGGPEDHDQASRMVELLLAGVRT